MTYKLESDGDKHMTIKIPHNWDTMTAGQQLSWINKRQKKAQSPNRRKHEAMQNRHRRPGVKILRALDPIITPILLTILGFLYDLFTWAANKKTEHEYKRRVKKT